ncbi:MAG: Ig-like domain-containing protein, partial [Propionibacteriaceae bacterium]|nr:Ig-like domain-containing protein [Propionibacteriaceae bacterium]
NGIQINDGTGDLTSGTTSTVQFNSGLPSSTLSQVMVSPVPNTTGAKVTVTVTVLDDNSNPIDGLTSSQVTVSGAYIAGSGTAGTAPTFDVDQNSFTPLGDGKYTYQATSDLVGNFTVTGLAEGVTINQQPVAQFVAGAVCVDNCTPKNPGADNSGYTGFVVTLNQQTADGNATDQVTAFAFDTMGNPVPNAAVTLNDTTSATGLTGLLSPQTVTVNTGTATSGVNGQAVASFKTNTVGSYTVSGKIGGLVPNANTTTLHGVTVQSGPGGTLSFVAGQANATASKLIISPLRQTVGAPVSVEVDVNDASGNPVADVEPTVAVNSTNATLPALTQTESGVWTGTLNSTVAGTYQVTATVPTTAGNQAVGGNGDSTKASPQNVAFMVGAICIPSACNVTPPTGVDPATVTTRVAVDPNGVVANGVAVDVATVYAFDQYGNPVPGAKVSTTIVESTLSAIKSSGTTDPATSVTAGQTTLTYSSTSATTQHADVAIVDPLDATQAAQGVPPTPIELDFVASAIDPAHSTFTVTTATGAPNAPQAADTPFTLSAQAKDSNGNAVEGATITFSAASGSTLSGQTCKTDSSGVCSVTVNSTVAGDYQVGATAPDSSGVSKPLGTATGDSTKASPQTVTWNAGLVCISPACTPQPGVTNVTSVVIDPNGVANDGHAQDVATVAAYDQWGNPVSGATVASSASGSNANDLKIQATINPTGTNGKTTIGYTSTLAGSYSASVTVVDPSNVAAGAQAVPPTPITLLFGSGLVDKDTSYFTVSPASPLTVGQDAANTYTVTVYANDAMSQPVDGAVISFSTAAGPVWAGAPATCTTGTSGRCQLAVYSTVAGTYTITVKAGSTVIAPQAAGGDQVAWTRNSFSAANSSWTLTPGGTMTAGVPSVEGGMYTATLTARDTSNNLIHDLDVSTIAFASSDTDPAAVTISSPVVSNGDGTYKVIYTSKLADTQPDGTTPIASVAQLTASITVDGSDKVAQDPTSATLVTDPSIHFVPGTADPGPVVCPDPSKTGTNFTVSTTSRVNGQVVILKAHVTDDQCNPVDGVPVTFTTDVNGQILAVASGDGSVGTASGTLVGTAVTGQTFPTQTATVSTDPGNAWVDLTDYVAPETTTVHATIPVNGMATDLNGGAPATTSPQRVNWTVGSPAIDPVCPAGSPHKVGTNISAQSPVTNPSSSQVNVLVTDQNCNPLPGVTVNFTIDSPTGSVPATATTGTSGVATVQATDTTAEWTTVQATIPSSDQPTSQVKNLKPATGAPMRANPARGADIDFLAVGTPSIDNPKPGDILATVTPEIDGTGAVPGDVIVVKDGNGAPIPGCDPVVNVNTDGTWNCTPTSPLPLDKDGKASVTPTQTDSSGDSADGPTTSFTVDTTPPTITGPMDGALTNNAKPDIIGAATQPGSFVTVTDNGTPIPGCVDVQVNTTGNADGTYSWTCTPTSALSDGSHTLVPSIRDSEHNQGPTGTAVKVNIDTTAPAAPTAKSDDGSKVTGTAEKGTTITVTDLSGKVVPGCVDVPVASNGTFSCTPVTKIAADATVYAWARDAAGNLSKPTQVTVPIPAAPAQVYVQTGGVPAPSISFGATTGSGHGLAGVALVIAVIRRREEVGN